MGISLTLYNVSDADLTRFQTDTAALNRVLAGEASPRQYPACYLSSYWRSLNSLLTEGRSDEAMPLAALKRGDLAFPEAEETAHALWSKTVRELATALGAFDEPQVRAFVERKRAEAERKYHGIENAERWVPSTAMVAQETAELWFYLHKIQEIVLQAAEHGQGLLCCFWEDW